MAGKMHSERKQQLDELHKMPDRKLMQEFLEGQCLSFSHLLPVRNEQLQRCLDVKDELISRRYTLDVEQFKQALR